ncbi:hypothetical protein WJX75_001903 [Coccomyxa subellipsoidea]|uniref:LITAF domain-containing protein n=1 Tax=Coccomyxa subellipsoidea TaxID=248742 RepID=A0ABR2YXF8_9CHLO
MGPSKSNFACKPLASTPGKEGALKDLIRKQPHQSLVMAPSRWTSFLGGGSKESDNSEPLVPDSNAPDDQQTSLISYPNASAPPMYPGAHGSSFPPDPDFPEPVKPSTSQQHSYAQHPPQPDHQEYTAPPPVYEQAHVADGYPVLPHATQPPTYVPPLVVNQELVVLEPLRGSPIVVTCPHCGHTGPAAVRKEFGFVTYFSSFMLCFLGCCVLSLFPFCSDCTKDWVYRCRRCGALFGRERP